MSPSASNWEHEDTSETTKFFNPSWAFFYSYFSSMSLNDDETKRRRHWTEVSADKVLRFISLLEPLSEEINTILVVGGIMKKISLKNSNWNFLIWKLYLWGQWRGGFMTAKLRQLNCWNFQFLLACRSSPENFFNHQKKAISRCHVTRRVLRFALPFNWFFAVEISIKPDFYERVFFFRVYVYFFLSPPFTRSSSSHS